MTNLNQFLLALNSSDEEVREPASRFVLREFKRSPSNLTSNALAVIANRLGDDSEGVRRNISVFFLEYAKAGKDLGQAWLNLAKYLRSRDQFVRRYVIESFGFLGNGENVLKSVLDNPGMPKEIKFLASEGLEHYYVRQKYFSSLGDLLKREEAVARGAFSGISVDRQLRMVKDKDLMPLAPAMRDARVRLAQPKRVIRRVPPRRPQDVYRRS